MNASKAIMRAIKTRSRLWLARFAIALGVVLAGGVMAVAATQSSLISDCLKNLDPAMQKVIQDAIASQPGLANNEQAIQVYMGILSQESGFRNVPSGGTSDRCPGIPVSYGIGQVNYSAHEAELRKKGAPASTGNYCRDLEATGRWMLAHPNETLQVSAAIYAENLDRCKGNALCAADRYCGGCDKHSAVPYTESIQGKIQKLGSCGDGSGLYAYTPTDEFGNPIGTPILLRCPDTNLAEALNKANRYFVASSMNSMRNARDVATTNAAQILGQSDSSSSSTVSLKSPLGDIRLTMCLDYINDFYTIIKQFLGKANLLISAIEYMVKQLLSAMCDYVAAKINNLLTSVCIPLPDLGLGAPGLGGVSRKGCSGISLQDLTYLTQTGRNTVESMTGYRYTPMKAKELVDPIVRAFDAPGTSPGTSQ